MDISVKFFIGILIILLLLFVYVFIRISSLSSESSKSSKKIDEIDTELNSVRTLKEEHNSTKGKIKRIQARIEDNEFNLMQADIDICNLAETIEEHHKRIAELKASIDDQAEDTDLLFKSIERQENELNKINQEFLSLGQSIITLQKAVNNILDIKDDSAKLNGPGALPPTEPKPDKKKTKNLPIDAPQNATKPNEQDDPEKINEEKQIIFNEIENTNKNFFITGKSGTGKSFLLKYFRENTKKRVICMAPTGISALQINGQTIHSVFGFDNIDNITGKNIKVSGNLRALLKGADVLIIDEISMVRADTFSNINKALQLANENEQPFGGKQVILFGDLFQLPPVAKDGEAAAVTDIYGGLFFFFSHAYKNGNFNFFELKELYRFEKKTEGQIRFIKVLDKAREGKLTKIDIDFLNKRYIPKAELDRTVMRLCSHNNHAANINSKRLSEIPAKEFTYNATVEYYKGEINETFKKSFPCAFELHLKVGAVVMMISNDTENKRWVNGTRGIVSYLSKDTIKVTIDKVEYEINKKSFSKKECVYEPETKKISYKTVASVEQYPVVLAYAISIHKSQGQTYPALACSASGSFAAGQAYVALSRCRDYEQLFLLEKLSKENFIVDSSVQNFYNSLISTSNNKT